MYPFSRPYVTVKLASPNVTSQNITVRRLHPPLQPAKTLRLYIDNQGRNHQQYIVGLVYDDESAFLTRCDGDVCFLQSPFEMKRIRIVLMTGEPFVNRITIMPRESDNDALEFARVQNDSSRYDTGSCVFVPLNAPREPDVDKIEAGKKQYGMHKKRITLETIGIVSIVGACMNAAGYRMESFALFIGGGLGIAYAVQLMKQIDNIENNLSSSIIALTRFSLTAIVCGYLFSHFSSEIRDEPALIIWALIGFMTYRLVAVIELSDDNAP